VESPQSLLDQLRAARARIDLDRLAANYRGLAAFASHPIMPVVKADAYGHGAVRVSLHLERLGAPLLAVAYVEEGLALRRGRVKVPVVVLAGFGPGQVHHCLEHDLTPVVSTPQMLDWVLAALRASGRRLAVHLKADTGMSRLGFAPSQVDEAASRLLDSGLVDVEGFMTHLASADESEAATVRQLDLFDEAVGRLEKRGVRPRFIHAANSAGLAFLRKGHNLARPGLLLYGLKPKPLSPPVVVKPVMSLSASIAQVKEIARGTAVSYGGRWVARRRSRLGTIPLGYADGVPRTRGMSAAGEFAVKGRRVPVAGTVCMDLTMVDLTDHPAAAEGDEAVLFGDDPTAWEVADWAGSNAWEVLTRVGARVPRVYLQSGKVVDVASPFVVAGS